MDGLWTCGVKYYPAFLGFRDARTTTLAACYQNWNREKVWQAVTRVIRTYRPDVLVTHATNGEYGHGAHRAMADAAQRCYSYAADPEKYPEDGEPWQVSKLYLHRWQENEQRFDWSVGLSGFNGKTSYAVATEALECHKSQMNGFWTMAQGEKPFTDNTLFGLCRSTVGMDTDAADMMEHLPQALVGSGSGV